MDTVNTPQRICSGLLVVLLGLFLYSPAMAQLEGHVDLAFSPEMEGTEANLDILELVLNHYTRIEAATTETARFVFVYGIGQGEEIVSGPFVSETVILSPGEPTLATRRGGAIDSPWEGYADPLLGLQDGEHGIWGTGNVGFGKPVSVVVNHEEQIPTPERLLNGIWGTGNVGVWGNGNVGIEPGDYGLVLFSMSLDEKGAFVRHSAAIVPFRPQTLTCTKRNPCGRLGLSFDPAISGVETDLRGLTDVLREYTQLDVASPKKAANVQFVYGIGHGEEVVGPFVSDEVVMVPGKPSLVARGQGPIASSWDAFDDPLVGFEEPALGFDDPLLGFDDPLLGFDDPLLGFDDPLLGLNAIWGTGNVGVWGNGNVGLEPDEYALIVFSMSTGKDGAPVLHEAAIVPFRVTEQAAAKQESNAAPETFVLEAAYPNPFNPQTTLRYALPEAAQVRLAVYDMLGREVALLADGMQEAGAHTVTFEASHLPSGAYLVRMDAARFSWTQRVTLIK